MGEETAVVTMVGARAAMAQAPLGNQQAHAQVPHGKRKRTFFKLAHQTLWDNPGHLWRPAPSPLRSPTDTMYS